MKDFSSTSRWPTSPIGAFAGIFDGPHATPKTVESGPLFLGISSLVDGRIELGRTRHVTEEDFRTWTKRVAPLPGDVVFSYETRLGQVAKIPEGMKCCLGRRMGLLRLDKSQVDPDFFVMMYLAPSYQSFLRSRTVQGATVDRLLLTEFKVFPFPVPSLDEQKRVVAVLDEAFEGLSRARANAEANLGDARELLQTTLAGIFSASTKGWKSCSVADSFVKTKVPAKIQRKDYLDSGPLPIISQEADFINGYWNNDADLVRVARPVILFGDHTRHIKLVDFDFVVGADGTQIMSPISEIDPEFYYFALRSIPLEGKGYARHFSHLKKERITYPTDMESQKAIAGQISEIEAHVRHLEESYRSRIAMTDALRQSLLQKAFSGDLA